MKYTMKKIGFVIILSVIISCLAGAESIEDAIKTDAGSADGKTVLHLDLEKSLILAEDNSQELHLLLLQMAAEKYSFDLSIREFLPRFSVGYSQNDTVITGDPDTRSKNLSFTVSQLLYNGGRTLINRDLTRMQLTLDQYNYKTKQEDLINQTWSMYNKILMFKAKQKVQEDSYNIALKQLNISRTEHKVGLLTEVDLLETEIKVKNFEAQIKDTQIQEEGLYFEFKKLLGIDPDVEIELDGVLDLQYEGLTLADNPEYWMSMAIVNNSDFKALQFNIEKQKQQVKLVEQSYLPKIDADFSVIVSSEYFPLQNLGLAVKLNFSFPFKPMPVQTQVNAGITGDRERSTGISMSTDLLPDLGFLVDHKMALLNFEMLRLQGETAVSDLRFKIQQSLKQYAQMAQKMKIQRESLKLYKRKLLIQERQLAIGEIKRVDYLESQSEYLDSYVQALQDQLSLMQMERDFEKLIGIEPTTLKYYAVKNEKEE